MTFARGDNSGAGGKTKNVNSHDPSPPQPSEPPDPLRPQFRLFTLFLLLTLFGLIFAAFHYIGPLGTFVLVLAILVIAAHVSGNAIGSVLRDNVRPASQPREDLTPRPAVPVESTPATQLSEKRSLGKPIYWVTAISGPIWGVVGISIAHVTSSKPISISNTIAGAVVLGMLGAFWTFVTGSFLQVGFGAFLHALRNSQPPPKNR